jgi:hypothetical protein
MELKKLLGWNRFSIKNPYHFCLSTIKSLIWQFSLLFFLLYYFSSNSNYPINEAFLRFFITLTVWPTFKFCICESKFVKKLLNLIFKPRISHKEFLYLFNYFNEDDWKLFSEIDVDFEQNLFKNYFL